MSTRLFDPKLKDLMQRFVKTKTLPRTLEPSRFVEEIVQSVSRETFRLARKSLSPDDCFYDRLFEISLCRLDVLSREKDLCIAFFDEMCRSPVLMLPFLRSFRAALREMILAAAKPSDAPLPFLFSSGFALAFSLALQRWKTTSAGNLDEASSCLDSGMDQLFCKLSIPRLHVEANIP